jgi:hypothetical protein
LISFGLNRNTLVPQIPAVAVLVAFQSLDQCAVRSQDIELNGHLADGMGGARKTWVIRTDGRFDPI